MLNNQKVAFLRTYLQSWEMYSTTFLDQFEMWMVLVNSTLFNYNFYLFFTDIPIWA